MSTAIAVQEMQSAPASPMTLIERAQASGASIEQMAQLFDLKLRWDADLARQAFNAAMNRFKAAPPSIRKDVTKQAGQMALNYASLENIVSVITPALSAQGLRHNWSVEQANGQMTVTCIITHEQGHSESVTMSGPYDQSGGKNAIQAIASANTYLKRYTLFAATGLAAGGEIDDDGSSASAATKPQMTAESMIEAKEAMRSCGTQEELRRTFQAWYKDAENLGDRAAQADLIKAKNEIKARLG